MDSADEMMGVPYTSAFVLMPVYFTDINRSRHAFRWLWWEGEANFYHASYGPAIVIEDLHWLVDYVNEDKGLYILRVNVVPTWTDELSGWALLENL